MGVNNGKRLQINFDYGPHGSAIAVLDDDHEDYHLDISPDLLAGALLSIIDELHSVGLEMLTPSEVTPERLPTGGYRIYFCETSSPDEERPALPKSAQGKYDWSDMDYSDTGHYADVA